MMWVLTGEEQYLKDSEAIGLETMLQKKQQAAEMRMQGLKTAKRKNKRRNIRYSNCSKTCKPANSWLAPHEDRLRNPKRTPLILKEITITTSGMIST